MGIFDVSPFELRVTDPKESRLHRLWGLRTVVGRHPAADVNIEEVFAAQKHCELIWDDNLACHLLIVYGRNGIYLNGTLVHMEAGPLPLSAGDELRIGGISMRYEEAIERGAG
jgi:pSer/pThr/pTyr-binding forkhead associated (FHA) protein